ncbi:MAG TPA: 3-phosphoshikimate 1-carboxyvinyltransferase [Burkholderiaceae bacterium]|nr:3-phosphoshikimate 1-carboxyvinyltransferase [Burkholderiaceae bacterium]HQR71657.1 3-phosphoshikimate 1-carboxyvinyltransferase [Burkholderiaceae bacterium]
MTAWPDVLTVDPIHHARGAVRLPGSKSISNRVLLLAALASGETRIDGLLDADDTRVMREALAALGVAFSQSGRSLCVGGRAGQFAVHEARLFLGNAGTAYRSLTAALAFSGGRYELDGVARMRERPVRDLVDALNSLGARIEYVGVPGYPPLRIQPARQLNADHVSVRGDVSSQFLTGLLMAAPLSAPEDGLRVAVDGPLISRPYVDMTVALMERFGVKVERRGDAFLVPRLSYRSPGRIEVEGDASGASYFLALGAIAGGPVRVVGVGRGSVQGDVAFAEALQAMGAQCTLADGYIEASAPRAGRLRGVDLDLNHIPDAAMTLAVAALFADGPTTLRNIGSWRVKETDRIAAMATELRKLGATVEEGPDWLRVHPPLRVLEATVDTYDDHRMAMCLSLAAAGGQPVHVRDPKCVSKTFPDYFDALAGLVSPAADHSVKRDRARS